jgi:hypothetical protein
VGEVAQVLVNGEDCGWAWAPPYTVDVTDRLRAGENTIAVRFMNTGIGALRAGTELTATVEAVTRIDGRRFRMQDLELTQRPTTSGLREVPALRFQRHVRQAVGVERRSGSRRRWAAPLRRGRPHACRHDPDWQGGRARAARAARPAVHGRPDGPRGRPRTDRGPHPPA